MAREPSLPPEVEEDPEAAAVRLWTEVRCAVAENKFYLVPCGCT